MQVGLHCSGINTVYISGATEMGALKSSSGTIIKKVENFKYLGSYVMDSEKDFRFRKVMAWNTCNKLDHIWCSNISNDIKIQLFCSTVEPILLYCPETWTLTKYFQSRLDGT